jgi:UDP-3-O-[3-hydroxymyristoyl] glucosamine N-acyltransferase
MMSYTAAQIAEQVRGEVLGDPSIQLTGIASPDLAHAGDLTFAEKDTYFVAAENSPASAILVSGDLRSRSKVLIRVPNPRVAVARVLPLFFPARSRAPGVHPSAVVAASASVDPTVHIGPGCVIEEGVRIGARTVLQGGNHLDRDSRLGEDVFLHPNVVVYARTEIGNRVTVHAGTVLGSDGYSYVFDEGRHRKMLQVGKLIIGDDVEIGANAAIDRGALGATVIGQGTKIDNLVHMAHNVVLGKHCIITGQVGFAGSTQLGDYCVVAAQSGIADHLKIGHQVKIGAKSGVMRDIPDGQTVLGIPALPHQQAKRQIIAAQRLPEVIRELRELAKKVEELSARSGA